MYAERQKLQKGSKVKGESFPWAHQPQKSVGLKKVNIDFQTELPTEREKSGGKGTDCPGTLGKLHKGQHTQNQIPGRQGGKSREVMMEEQPRHQITDPGSSEHIHQEPHWGRSQANCKK